MLLVVVVARAATAWYTEVSANRASSRVKSQLRVALVEKLAAEAPRAREESEGHLTTLATHGVDALDGYFSRYLPQLVLAVIVPVAVIVAVCTADWVSAAIIAITVPLIPLFMALIGMRVQRRQDHQLRTLQVLSGHFLDVVRGLTTLKVFGRSKAQVETIRSVTDSYRRTTMSTLKLAFLSSLVLELLASVSVALVAVSVGLRLLYGHLDLRTSLFALVLAPEAYLPAAPRRHQLPRERGRAERSRPGLRGARAPDARAWQQSRRARPGHARSHDRSSHGRVPGQDEARDRPAARSRSNPAKSVAITGPSGCGKSTLVAVLLGFATPSEGAVRIGDVDLAEVDPAAWREHIAWVPQRPHLFAASIAENLRLGAPRCDRRRALERRLGRVARAPDRVVARSARHEARRAWQWPLRR